MLRAGRAGRARAFRTRRAQARGATSACHCRDRTGSRVNCVSCPLRRVLSNHAQCARRCAIDRLVLWNIDLTLIDVGKVARDAIADAFNRVTGRPLAALPQLAGRSDTEIFFESLYLNDVPTGAAEDADLLARYCHALESAFAKRHDDLVREGRLLPGAHDAVLAVAGLPGVVQTVLTGTIKPNAVRKLAAFGLDSILDTQIGGYGSDAYPRGSLLLEVRRQASEKYGAPIEETPAVYIADTARDVEAAAIGGARSIAVASGREMAAELDEAGAEAVLVDLADTAQVLAAVDRLTRPMEANANR